MNIDLTLTISLGVIISVILVILKNRRGINRMINRFKKEVMSREGKITKEALKIITAEMKIMIKDILDNLGYEEIFIFINQFKQIIVSFRAKFTEGDS